jgi:hypothetical protein
MRLPNFEQNAELNELRRLMGATALGDLSLEQAQNLLTETELEALAGIGIDVQWDQVRALSDGTLAYKDRRVVLYIRDVSLHGNKSIADVMPKFHVARCRTLDEMHAQGRGKRYVVATRTTGEFAINVMRNGTLSSQRDLRLAVCQNCLDHLSFDSFSYKQNKVTRDSIVARFTLDRFFSHYPIRILDDRGYERADTAPLNEYPPDFADRARQIKAQQGYRCEGCGWTPRTDAGRRFIHLHHKNALKYDNSLENFAVLCIECHTDQPLHAHLLQHPDYIEFGRVKAIA